jgi:Uma2 family endonuclease
MKTLFEDRETKIFYSCTGHEPVESHVHLYALIITLEVLRQYVRGQQAVVLGKQFLHCVQEFPRLRVLPDIMVILNVVPGKRDCYKTWEEADVVPSVVFEMTSRQTKEQDLDERKTFYEGLGVQEYWLFDPQGEWVEGQLRGYRLRDEEYQPITDNRCKPLQLRLQAEGQLIGFYRKDTGEKLLIPQELADALEQTEVKKQQLEVENKRLKAQLKALGAEPDLTD